MISLLIIDDELRVASLITGALSEHGYSIVNAPQTQGSVRLIKKIHGSRERFLSDSFLDLTDILVKYKSGEIYKSLLLQIEKPLIETVLKRTEGNKVKAAKLLGINRNTLDAKIKKLEIDVQKWKI